MKQVNNKDQLYSTWNYMQSLVMICNGKESKKSICVYV